MKMTYVLKSSIRGRGSIPPYLKIVFITILILTFLYIFLPKVLPSIFITLVGPFWNIENVLRNGDASRAELQKVYSEAWKNTLVNNAIVEENHALKDLLGRSDTDTHLLATIMKRPPFTAYDTFILDVGEVDGVKVGDKVFALGNIPIGLVAEVVHDTSKVRLYSSSGEKFSVIIGSSAIEASAIGKSGGFFEVSLPRDTNIKVGDIARIPSIDDSFIGTVEGIASDPSEPFSKVLFRQPLNIYEMRWVLVNINNE